MKRYQANQQVEEGIYFNPRRLAFRSMEEPGRLPGEAGDSYIHVPAPMLLLLGAPLSLAFVIFLPLIGFVMLAGVLSQKIAARLRGEVAAVPPQMAPGEVANQNDVPAPQRPETVPEPATRKEKRRAKG